MEQNLNLNIENAGQEIIIRQGDALPPVPPERIALAGNISTVSNFLSVRKDLAHGLQTVSLDRAVVIVDKAALSITLMLDPENAFGAKVTAKLEPSDELKAFAINSEKTFTREQLVKLIRFNKVWFENPDKHAVLLAAYMAFDASTNSTLQQSSDTRGNKGLNLQKSVSTNVPTEFILNIPIFKGEPKARFRVEICLDVTDAGARFWFESVELHELTQQLTDEIFEEELKACEGFVIISK